MERGTCIFDFRCARKGEDTKSIKVLVDVSKMIDKVVVAEKTKCPVDKTEEKKEAWDNPFFCNYHDGIFKLIIEDSNLSSSIC